MTQQALIVRYVIFAVLATLANLATQRLILLGGSGGRHFTLAVASGTLVGLILKYLLDKRWIFFDIQTGVKAHSQKFTLYAAMGLITTSLFWAAETTFWLLWQTEGMRELGAILGLAVGYLVKYKLDRRFVFTDVRLGGSA